MPARPSGEVSAECKEANNLWRLLALPLVQPAFPSDAVLEPSAGTGLLAILAELPGATLTLNELHTTCYLGLLQPARRAARHREPRK